MSSPRAIGNPPLEIILRKSVISINPRSETCTGVGEGTSSPTKASPGTGASIRRLGVLSAKARSFSRFNMLWTLTLFPSEFSRFPLSPFFICHPGTNPKRIILGPALISFTSTLTPWSDRVVSMSADMLFKGD